jgi:aspartate aminotransferase-like enzyme
MARLFTLGPTDVEPDILQAQAQPLIGHRSQAFADLIGNIQPKLQRVLKTQHRVYVTTSSDTGLQDGAVRNWVLESGMTIANGYGHIADETFRTGHMGEIQEKYMENILAQIDNFPRN